MKEAKYWIDSLGLMPHPEGGYFKEVYRSKEEVSEDALPKRFSGARSFSTSIYFLLENTDFSAFHKIKSDELWHFYMGETLDIYMIHPDGKAEVVTLGQDPQNGNHFQFAVPAGSWFAAKPQKESDYALVGCTVSPGFDFHDFEMAKKESMLKEFPQHAEWIKELCLD